MASQAGQNYSNIRSKVVTLSRVVAAGGRMVRCFFACIVIQATMKLEPLRTILKYKLYKPFVASRASTLVKIQYILQCVVLYVWGQLINYACVGN